MKWKELNKESLELLKKDKLTFWCFVKDTSPYVHELYRICLVSRVHNHPLSGDYWFVITARYPSDHIRQSINDEEMLDFFSDYCIVVHPERKNSED